MQSDTRGEGMSPSQRPQHAPQCWQTEGNSKCAQGEDDPCHSSNNILRLALGSACLPQPGDPRSGSRRLLTPRGKPSAPGSHDAMRNILAPLAASSRCRSRDSISPRPRHPAILWRSLSRTAGFLALRELQNSWPIPTKPTSGRLAATGGRK